MGFGAWPSCNHPRTLSFRAGVGDSYSQGFTSVDVSTSSIDEHSLAAALPWEDHEDLVVDSVMRAVRSPETVQQRWLFFDPSGNSSSLLLPVTKKQPESPTPSSHKGAAFRKVIEEMEGATVPFKGGGIAVAVSSTDPYTNFRKSMEDMVAAHGWMGWDWLQDMLEWYLQANGSSKSTVHSDTIVRAFVDMLMDQVLSVSPDDGAGSASSSSCSSSAPASPAHSSSSSFSSMCSQL